MIQFDVFQYSHLSEVTEAARLLKQVTQSYQVNTISKIEYEELCADILDYNRISATISDMTRLQGIQNAFRQLASIVSTIAAL